MGFSGSFDSNRRGVLMTSEELQGQIMALTIGLESLIRALPQDQRNKVGQNLRVHSVAADSQELKKAYLEAYGRIARATQ